MFFKDALYILAMLIFSFPFASIAGVASLVSLFMSFSLRRRVRILEQALARSDLTHTPPVTEQPSHPVPPVTASPEPDASPEPVPSLPQPNVQDKTKPSRSFEETFGTRWVVWIGGVAMSLGGLFLVRYSIEQGYFGPLARIMMGVIFSLALAAAGEWMRRKATLPPPSALRDVDVPAMLTASSIITGFAVIYAAFELYHLLSPAMAFILMAAASLLAILAALRHGPVLATLGLVGGTLVPLLVSSEVPNFWALVAHLGFVTAASLITARIRLWRWVAALTLIFSIGWGLLMLGSDAPAAPVLAHAVLGMALVALIIVPNLAYGPRLSDTRIDGLSSSALAAYVMIAALQVMISHHSAEAVAVLILMCIAVTVIAWRAPAAVAAVPASGALAALSQTSWAAVAVETLLAPSGPLAGVAPEPATISLTAPLFAACLVSGLFLISGFLAQGRTPRALISILWASSAAFVPVAVTAALYMGLEQFHTALPFSLIGAGLAFIYVTGCETLLRRPAYAGQEEAAGLFAAGAVAALALAMSMNLEKGWLTVGLSLIPPALAWISTWRPISLLRWIAAATALCVALRMLWAPVMAWEDIGTTPVFNWLLYGYGLPAVASFLAAFLFRRTGDDIPVRLLEALAVVFTTVCAVTVTRHAMRLDPNSYSSSLLEAGISATECLALVIGLHWLSRKASSAVYRQAAQLFLYAGLIILLLGPLLMLNPYLEGEKVGSGLILNALLPAYGLPALLCLCLTRLLPATDHPMIKPITQGMSLVLGFAYVTLLTSNLFRSGQNLSLSYASQTELYTISVIWLVFGLALLLAGLVSRSPRLRLASLAVMMLTIGKVFLFDSADLDGALRAFSFAGLGLALVAVGLIYQKLLFRKQ